MPKDDELLRSITTFPRLVKYLRDELQWPIEETSFDDLTFDYLPEELGLDPKTAVKIRSIKQLRPLTAGQPWGVFFVEFERKRLPVVVMRRILSALALKKRASAGKSGQAAWRASDLLFISSFGEEGGRGITFAHFAPDEQGHDLPALKVLGWDGDDTKLHTQAVAESLASSLTWPLNARDINAWRTQWSSAFVLANREVVTTSRELSIQLAKLAVGIRKRAKDLLASESDRGPLRKLHKAFKEALLHDLDEDGFADMYAQTVAYGLLAARLENPDSPTPLTASALADMIPATSPFLKGLLSTFLKVGGRKGYLDFDELGIGDIVDLLRNAKMKAILLDFGDLKPDEDPVLHFYELFLNEYDHEQKMQRGVFYTPKPVVHYIVHSIDEILRTEFGLADGLADTTTWSEMASRRPGVTIPKGLKPDDPFVQVLDPATGTATFLVEVIDVIYSTMTAKWRSQGKSKTEVEKLWNEYVPLYLLPRLYGFEILIAPYTIAQIKFGLKLRETGYHFGSTQRSRIYLTNTLEDPTEFSDPLGLLLPALAEEARAVTGVKRSVKPTVVLGNPPYSGTSSNKGEWISKLINDYKRVDGKPLGEKNPKYLQDDYVKFMRFAQWDIERSGTGVLGFITNHNYLDNPTFRGMRQSLMTTYDQMHFLNLHGNVLKKEKCPDGSKDENVFDIQQGVAIVLGTKHHSTSEGSWYSDLHGSRDAKNTLLSSSRMSRTEWQRVTPLSKMYFFTPQSTGSALEYTHWHSLTDIFPVYVNGFKSHRDHFAVAFEREQVMERLEDMASHALSDDVLREKYNLADNGDWLLPEARRRIRSLGSRWRSLVITCAYKPFDERWCCFDEAAMDRPRRELKDHVGGKENLCLLTVRQMQDNVPYTHVEIVSTVAVDRVFACSRGAATVIPLYCYDTSSEGLAQRSTSRDRHANFGASVLGTMTARLKLKVVPDGRGDPVHGTIGPEDILAYVYAILYSPSYRIRYGGFLKSDFPRIPIPRLSDTCVQLLRLGQQLIDLHLLQSQSLDDPISSFCGKGDHAVTKVKYDADSARVSINPTQYFGSVMPDVWSYQVGGYQVLQKWLKDRGPKGGQAGRVLSLDDILHYRKVVTAIAKTIELQAEIDRVIAAAGGFPAAFQ